MKKYLKAACALPVALAGSMACYLPFVVADAARGFNDECDYVIILGSTVIGADEPSPVLRERIKRAAQYMSAHPDAVAVPTGGCFRREQTVSEAEIIKRGMVELGVAEERILPESNATTTYENFINSFRLIEEHSGKGIGEVRVAALSSSYHMHRAAVIARQCGKSVGRVSAHTPRSLRPWIREYFVAYEILLKILKIKA